MTNTFIDSDDMFEDEPVPLEAQLRCVEREIKKRQSVYERLVSKGRMTKARAQCEIRAMRAVRKTLQELVERT